MNKAKLAGDVANQTGVTKKTFREAVEATVSAITGSLFEGGSSGEKCIIKFSIP